MLLIGKIKVLKNWCLILVIWKKDNDDLDDRAFGVINQF